MNHLLVKYIYREGKLADPSFTHLTYGDTDKANQLIKAQPGSYVFFHTSYDGKPYITAYFYVERVLTKEKNQTEISLLPTGACEDSVVIFGSRMKSKILTIPLLFDEKVLKHLPSLDIDTSDYSQGSRSWLATLSSPTRQHRPLRDGEVEWLLEKCRFRG